MKLERLAGWIRRHLILESAAGSRTVWTWRRWKRPVLQMQRVLLSAQVVWQQPSTRRHMGSRYTRTTAQNPELRAHITTARPHTAAGLRV